YFITCRYIIYFFFFSSRRRHTIFSRDWSSDVCSSDLASRSADHCSAKRYWVKTWNSTRGACSRRACSSAFASLLRSGGSQSVQLDRKSVVLGRGDGVGGGVMESICEQSRVNG